MDYKSVENILQKAMDLASEREHEYVTLEHILLQLIKSKPILKLCEEVQVDVTSLQEDLENYLEGDEDNLKGQNGAKGAPKKTISVERVIQRGLANAVFSGRDVIEPIDLLLSIGSEETSYARYYMQLNGLDKESIIGHLESRDYASKSQELLNKIKE